MAEKKQTKTEGKIPEKAKPKAAAKNTNNTAEVDDFIKKLKHPLTAEIEAVRGIIKNVDTGICERIKWNAPSFFYIEDMVTFHVRPLDKIHLVFHHPHIVKIKSDLLEGDYKDRRMMYFKDMAEIKKNKKELERIISELVKELKTKHND